MPSATQLHSAARCDPCQPGGTAATASHGRSDLVVARQSADVVDLEAEDGHDGLVVGQPRMRSFVVGVNQRRFAVAGLVRSSYCFEAVEVLDCRSVGQDCCRSEENSRGCNLGSLGWSRSFGCSFAAGERCRILPAAAAAAVVFGRSLPDYLEVEGRVCCSWTTSNLHASVGVEGYRWKVCSAFALLAPARRVCSEIIILTMRLSAETALSSSLSQDAKELTPGAHLGCTRGCTPYRRLNTSLFLLRHFSRNTLSLVAKRPIIFRTVCAGS